MISEILHWGYTKFLALKPKMRYPFGEYHYSPIRSFSEERT